MKILLVALFSACMMLVAAGSSAQDKQVDPEPKKAGTKKDWKAELEKDWPEIGKYKASNAKLQPPAPGEDRVVFIGDAMVEIWTNSFSKLFPGKPYVGRGIRAQTLQQLLIRFRPDVIELKPKVVVILGGTPDVAGNTGRQTHEMIVGNFKSIVELAMINKIRPVVMSIPPTHDYPWQKGMEPAEKIVKLNAWLKDYAAKNGAVYVDCHTPLADPKNGMKKEYTTDGVHPNAAGFAVMSPLVQGGIEQALKMKW